VSFLFGFFSPIDVGEEIKEIQLLGNCNYDCNCDCNHFGNIVILIVIMIIFWEY